MKILVTGTAGFIGYNLVTALLKQGIEVIGLDNINDYYDVNLKYNRLKETGIFKDHIEYNVLSKSEKYPNYSFIKLNIEDKENLLLLFKAKQPDIICHLAAQAGVRYSITNPYAYIQSNIVGFLNILEGCRNSAVKHLVYASSSSVYGLNQLQPYTTLQNTNHPASLYAATKKSNELMAHAYSYLFNIPTTGLRFFTVYGPWGRPDMAPHLFTKAILENTPIDVYNNGDMERDFTYIDDVINGILSVINVIPVGSASWNAMDPDPSHSCAPYRLYNIGNSHPIKLLDFINALETNLKLKAIKKFLPLQKGDVLSTFADISDMETYFDYKPTTAVEVGVQRFVNWYLKYYNI